MKVFLLIYFLGFYLVCFSNGKRKAQGKVSYALNWSGGFKICENFEDSIVDVTPLKVEKVSAVNTLLSGEFEFTSPILPDTAMLLKVEKETPQGKVLAFTYEMPDMCSAVPDLDKPWTMVFDAMELDPRECPLPAKKFVIAPFAMSLAAAKDFLTHEYVGEYAAIVELSQKGNGQDVMDRTIGCYTFSFSVDEVREQAEETTESSE